MAKSLLNKLGTLLQAQIRGEKKSKRSPTPKKVNQQLTDLRERYADAEQQENALDVQVVTLQAQVLNLDERADAALQAAREAEAKHLVQKMDAEKQRLQMAISTLEDHRQTMAVLLKQITELDAHLNPEIEAPPEPISTQLENIETHDDNDEQELAARRARLAKPDKK